MSVSPISYIQGECNKHFPEDGNGPVQAQLFCHRLVRANPAALGYPHVGQPLSEHDQAVIKNACEEFKNMMDSVEEQGKQLLDPTKKRKAEAEPVKKSKKPKKAKKPKQPLRPLSAYMLYVQKNRSEIVAMNPDAKFTDIGKMLGNGWAKMSEADKQVYVDMANDEKSRYGRELRELEPSNL